MDAWTEAWCQALTLRFCVREKQKWFQRVKCEQKGGNECWVAKGVDSAGPELFMPCPVPSLVDSGLSPAGYIFPDSCRLASGWSQHYWETGRRKGRRRGISVSFFHSGHHPCLGPCVFPYPSVPHADVYVCKHSCVLYLWNAPLDHYVFCICQEKGLEVTINDAIYQRWFSLSGGNFYDFFSFGYF